MAINECDPLIEKIRQGLEAEAEGLSGRTKAGLAAARRAALSFESAESTGRGLSLRRFLFPESPWARAAAVGGLAVAAVFLTVNARRTDLDRPSPAPIAQIDLLASEKGLEFYENLEFSAWLAEARREG